MCSPRWQGPRHLLDAIELFIDDFYLVLLELSETVWQQSKQGLIHRSRKKMPTCAPAANDSGSA